jgi:DNA-binding Lrp family transcriptional regulator
MLKKINQKILNLMLENSRLSFREIAKKLKVSVVTIIKHVKDMQENEIISNYSVDIDYEKLGYDVVAIVDLRITKGKLFEVEKKVATMKNVFAVYDVTGGYDCVVIAKFKSRKSLDGFLKKIQSFDFIERTNTKLVLNTIKEKNIEVDI